jgi:hypothetical protein
MGSIQDLVEVFFAFYICFIFSGFGAGLNNLGQGPAGIIGGLFGLGLDSDEANRRLAAAAAEEARKEKVTADAAKKAADKSLIYFFVFFLIYLSFFVCLFLFVFLIYLFVFFEEAPFDWEMFLLCQQLELHADTKSADQREAEWNAVDPLLEGWVCLFDFFVCLFVYLSIIFSIFSATSFQET